MVKHKQHMSGHVTCIICKKLSILKRRVQQQEYGVWMEKQEVRIEEIERKRMQEELYRHKQ